MSKPKTAPKGPTANDLALLGQAVDALVNNAPLMTTKQSMHIWLTMAGGPYVEFHDGLKGPNNTIACRATAAGKIYSEVNGRPSSAAPGVRTPAQALASPEAPEFRLDDAFPIPPLKRFGAGRQASGQKYPLMIMNIGQSFFIPKTDSNLKPAQRVAALVSLMQKNNPPRRYRVQVVTEPQGEGARVWRIADFTPEELAKRAARPPRKSKMSSM